MTSIVLQEILLMKQRVAEMEKEASKLRELQAAAEKAESGSPEGTESGVPMETEEDRAAADGRSIYVGNVSLNFFAIYPGGLIHVPVAKG